ncbi:alpha/beta hydrolase fold domain-containing protein [Streptomyces griseoviridis]|uniref:Esterase n=1 Tax=Streptomyces griseoviridis TaxID=45398 RepID=A0A918GQB8_STRGD|nr:alpha/beta hydrolase fold domain-containing protein [Streptomyces niveoruber]GGS52164.1 esterase [Streptomyces niveoruber]
MPGPTPPVDPELASLAEPGPPRGTPTLDELRRDGDFLIEERRASVRGPAPDVPVLVCRPAEAAGRLPVLLLPHGGGPRVGPPRRNLAYYLRLARELNAAVVAVAPRSAPDHLHPAASEDCLTVMTWLSACAHDLAMDTERVVLLGLGSAGTLAGGLALRLRDRLDLRPLGQMLLSPVLDDRTGTASAARPAPPGTGAPRTDEDARVHARGDLRGTSDVPPYAAPARAEDLSGLPPAYLEVGALDILRDEVVTYAQRVWAAGGDAELHVWAGAFYGFDFLAPAAALSRRARATRLDWLRRILIRS